jgi:hypothetical protein
MCGEGLSRNAPGSAIGSLKQPPDFGGRLPQALLLPQPGEAPVRAETITLAPIPSARSPPRPAVAAWTKLLLEPHSCNITAIFRTERAQPACHRRHDHVSTDPSSTASARTHLPACRSPYRSSCSCSTRQLAAWAEACRPPLRQHSEPASVIRPMRWYSTCSYWRSVSRRSSRAAMQRFRTLAARSTLVRVRMGRKGRSAPVSGRRLARLEQGSYEFHGTSTSLPATRRFDISLSASLASLSG